MNYFEASPYYGEKDEDGNEPILGWGVWCVPDSEWVVEDGLDQADAENGAHSFNIWVGQRRIDYGFVDRHR